MIKILAALLLAVLSFAAEKPSPIQPSAPAPQAATFEDAVIKYLTAGMEHNRVLSQYQRALTDLAKGLEEDLVASQRNLGVLAAAIRASCKGTVEGLGVPGQIPRCIPAASPAAPDSTKPDKEKLTWLKRFFPLF